MIEYLHPTPSRIEGCSSWLPRLLRRSPEVDVVPHVQWRDLPGGLIREYEIAA